MSLHRPLPLSDAVTHASNLYRSALRKIEAAKRKEEEEEAAALAALAAARTAAQRRARPARAPRADAAVLDREWRELDVAPPAFG